MCTSSRGTRFGGLRGRRGGLAGVGLPLIIVLEDGYVRV